MKETKLSKQHNIFFFITEAWDEPRIIDNTMSNKSDCGVRFYDDDIPPVFRIFVDCPNRSLPKGFVTEWALLDVNSLGNLEAKFWMVHNAILEILILNDCLPFALDNLEGFLLELDGLHAVSQNVHSHAVVLIDDKREHLFQFRKVKTPI